MCGGIVATMGCLGRQSGKLVVAADNRAIIKTVGFSSSYYCVRYSCTAGGMWTSRVLSKPADNTDRAFHCRNGHRPRVL